MTTDETEANKISLPPTPWDVEAARFVVAALKESGHTVTKFAKLHNVTPYKVRRCQRLTTVHTKVERIADSPLVALRVKPSAKNVESASASTFEVKMQTGLTICFPQSIASQSLVRIIECVKAAAC